MNSFWELFTEDAPQVDQNPWLPLCAVDYSSEHFCFALSDVPIKRATEHQALIGTTSSGKSTFLSLLLQSIAPRFQPTHPHNEHLILFDFKGNALPILDSLGIPPDREDVWILNPFDQRGVKWNIGAAINSPAMARYFASLMVPHEAHTTAPYFNNAARQIVCWTAIALMNVKPGTWTMRDLINALESKERMLSVCSRFPRAKAAVAQHCNDKTNFGGVLSTLETKLGEFHEVAALWDTSPSARSFSVSEFLKNRGVLILGYDPVLEESIWPMNAIILKALTNEILRENETKLPRHWFVLDEFLAMQKVDSIRKLLNFGRSKGVAATLVLQSIEGLRELYGPEGTEAILEVCTNKTFLRAGGPVTAEWAERYFNKIRQTERSTGISRGPGGVTRSENFQVNERSLFLASEFLNLPLPESGGSFKAISDIPSFNEVLINDWRADDVFAMIKPVTQVPGVPGVIRREDPREQYLNPWTAQEERQICNTTSPDTPLRDELPGMPTKSDQQKRRHRK